IASCPKGLVVVSGSAGKSSTTHQLVKLLESHSLKVFTNPSTANIRQGLFSAVLKEANLAGKINHDIAVLEWDEGHGAMLAGELNITLAVFTNVLSDQLDRFVDPELVTEKLAAIADAAKQIVSNSDDKNLAQFAHRHSSVIGYGLSGELLKSDLAPEYALNFGPHPEIERKVQVVTESGYSVTLGNELFRTPVESPELALNYAAALAAASVVVALDSKKVASQFESAAGVFARNERVEIFGRNVNLRLVQNPTSFQLNVDELPADATPLMLMAGSDIHDPSWLWTVDFGSIKRVDIVSGSNAFELALRLSVAGVEIGEVLPEIPEATKAFFELQGDAPTILFSADAMRRFRRHTQVAK
ncbi:MAG TPA: MurT ligase domain-containing protein, partial [Aquiluna sp.]